jgi:Ca2+-binding RTX toxin-like protein
MDNVVLGSTAPVLGGTLANFGAPVYVGNAAGSTRLILDDSGDAIGRTATFFPTYVTGFGTAFIVFEPGVTGLTIEGGSGGNAFTFAGTISGTTTLDSGSGNDTVTVQGTGGPLLVRGGTGTNTLIGPNAVNTWKILGANYGSVAGITFTGFGNLTGGSGLDVFLFNPGASLTGTIDGGGGGDWLDYSLYSSSVSANLTTGTATGTGGVRNILGVRGGSGGNTLIGNAQGNILIGGSGADVIDGGSGRSILIGGQGVDSIVGGSGDDIVIGGSTSFDSSSIANDLALEAILAEWQSTTDSYATRITKIKTGVDPNGIDKFVFGLTVIDDGIANTLTGGDGMDWFFKGFQDNITDSQTGEQIN